MSHRFNIKEMTNRRKDLRNKMTEAELILWSVINKVSSKHRFVRQYSIASFVTDFYCRKLKLAIEVDGDIHKLKDQEEYDKYRQISIETHTVTFLRFSNHQIKNELTRCLIAIKQTITRLKQHNYLL